MRAPQGVLRLCVSVALGGCTATPVNVPTVAPSALPQQVPIAADAFVNSIGVNTHLIDDLTLDREYGVITARMRELGIRHIRDGIFPGETAREYREQRQFFAATGARMEAITDCPRPLGYYPGSYTSPHVIRTYDAKVGHAVELLEGPNEPDLRHVPNWAPLTIACMRQHDLTKTLPVPFVAPAMGDAIHGNPQKLGNIAGLVDFGAIHRYFSPGWNPGWAGYGRSPCGAIESLTWAICEAKVNAGPHHPIYVTETGYTTIGPYGPYNVEVDEITDAKYISRVLLVDSLGGIVRTYVYELHDDGHDKQPWENGFGLIHYDGSPKPAFNAVRSMIAILADPGPDFSPIPLRYEVESNVASIEHELFQKRNGSYYLALWNETTSWNPATGREVHVPLARVLVIFAHPPGDVRYGALRDDGQFAARSTRVVGSTVEVPVDDHVAFLSFH